MTAAAGLDWFRELLWITVVVSGPPILAGLVSGLFMAVLQASTQVNDAAIGFVPKAASVVVAITVAGGWMLERVAEFTTSAISAMSRIHP